MIGQDMVNRLYDCQVVDPQGQKIGSVKRVWLDGQTGDPAWAEVHTGLFGLKETFVPLQRAELHDDQVQVSVAKEQVKDAPRIEVHGDELTNAEQQTLYQHYGVPSPTGPQNQRGQQTQRGHDQGGQHRSGQYQGDQMQGGQMQAGQHQARQQQASQQQAGQRQAGQHQRGQDQGGRGSSQRPESGQHSGGMTRSEERLRVDTEQVETGRVRLVKHVVTEQQQVNVPVSHEEVRIERTPITGRDTGTADIGEAEQEVRLHAERPVVSKETVPVEKVDLNTELVTEQQTVSGEVRKEQIDVEDDQTRGGGRKQPPR